MLNSAFLIYQINRIQFLFKTIDFINSLYTYISLYNTLKYY